MLVKLIYADNHVDHHEMTKWLPDIRVAERKMIRFMAYPVTLESMTYKPSWFIRTFEFHSEVDGMWLYKERIG